MSAKMTRRRFFLEAAGATLIGSHLGTTSIVQDESLGGLPMGVPHTSLDPQ